MDMIRHDREGEQIEVSGARRLAQPIHDHLRNIGEQHGEAIASNDRQVVGMRPCIVEAAKARARDEAAPVRGRIIIVLPTVGRS
jgi:hypothetical protein